MAKFLHYDSFLNQALRKLADCFCLSLMWTLCCIPVITAGAATTALYYAATKAIRYDRGGIWREYWSAFRSNFRQATLVWFLLLGIGALIFLSIRSAWLLYGAGRLSLAAVVLLLVLAAHVAMWASYLFPHLARFQTTVPQLLKNCELMALMHFFRSLALLALLAAAVLGLLFAPFSLLYVPGLTAWTSGYILERIFRKYMSPEDRAAEEEKIRDAAP